MAIGPGKYDDLCTYVAEKTGVTSRGGAAFIIVINGDKGSGFSSIGDLWTMMRVPDVLESMAKQIREDLAKGKL